MRYLGLLGILSILNVGACSSRKNEIRQNRARSEELRKNLRVGMNKGELKALGFEPANCRGNPNTLEKCEVRFFTDYSTGWIAPSDYSTQKYEIYDMTFEKSALTLWQKRADQRVQQDHLAPALPPSQH